MGAEGWRKGAALSAMLLALGTGVACDRSANGEDGTVRAAPAEAVAVVDSLFAAMNAGDADRILGLYAQSPDLVTVQCTAMRLGHESLARVVRMYYGAGPRAALEHEVVRSVSLGAGGALVATMARDTAGTELFQTYTLRRTGDGWRIAAEHESWAHCPPTRRHPNLGPAGGPVEGGAGNAAGAAAEETGAEGR